MKTFTKWFVLFAIIVTGMAVAVQQGAFTAMLANDHTYISLLCLVVFVGFSVQTGMATHKLEQPGADVIRILHSLQPSKFVARILLSVGLLGTTLGLAITMNTSLKNLTGDTTKIGEVLIGGVGSTLYTTITALACSILLELQLFLVQHSTNLIDEEDEAQES
jgi:hypothetical protein